MIKLKVIDRNFRYKLNLKSQIVISILLLFVLSAAVPVIPCSYIPNYGLFGELKSSVIASEDREEISEISAKIYIREKQKGKNIFNVWFLLLAHIVCVRLLAHSFPLPRADTIVTQKIRMNN